MAVVANEIDRSERAVLFDLPHYTPQSCACIGRCARIGAVAVKCQREQPAVGRYIKPHPLVHDRLHARIHMHTLVIDLRQGVFGKNDHRLIPVPAVFGSDDQGLARRGMLLKQVAQVLDIKLTIPVSQKRLMVVGPAKLIPLQWFGTVGPVNLIMVNAHRMRQLTVVKMRVRCAVTHINNRLFGAFFY